MKSRLWGSTWKLGCKQDPCGSIAGGIRAEAVGQQRDRAEGQSLGDAHGGGEANHSGSNHADPYTLHSAAEISGVMVATRPQTV